MCALVADPEGAANVIVAAATPSGAGALAIVRLSGPAGAALATARRLAPALRGAPEPRRALLSRLVDETGREIDEGIAILFDAPHSATGEEVVELHCHGARAIVAALVRAACRAGARPARPGEFTLRALANGRLDLARAEAVAQLTSATSRNEAHRALGLYDGALSRAVHDLRERALDLLAGLEAGLDFVEDVPLVPAAEQNARLDALAREAARLARAPLARCGAGAPAVAILGRTNAGKSTLFNALLGEDRAIVTEHPGTTRDVLAEEVELFGERVRLLDTAGLRREPGPVESLGIERALAVARAAACVLYVVDGSAGIDDEDRAALSALDGRALLVLAKSDLPRTGAVPEEAVTVSAATGQGLDVLSAAIGRALGVGEPGGDVVLLERHREALARAEAELREARIAMDAGEEFAAAALRRALHALGEITGETATQELLEKIFAGFCIGK